MMYRIDLLSEVILHHVYKMHITSDSPYIFNEHTIKNEIANEVTLNLARSAIDQIRKKSTNEGGSLIRRQGEKGRYEYEITNIGISYVQNEIQRRDSPIAYMHAVPEFSLHDVAGLDSDFMTTEARRERNAWKPLEIDRSTTEYKETTAELEKAIEVIEKDNGFAINMQGEREGILQSLKTGLMWLKDKCPTRIQLVDMVIRPLRWLTASFSQTIIGETAKAAAKKLLEFLNWIS